jgi:hypothetical protein
MPRSRSRSGLRNVMVEEDVVFRLIDAVGENVRNGAGEGRGAAIGEIVTNADRPLALSVFVRSQALAFIERQFRFELFAIPRRAGNGFGRVNDRVDEIDFRLGKAPFRSRIASKISLSVSTVIAPLRLISD